MNARPNRWILVTLGILLGGATDPLGAQPDSSSTKKRPAKQLQVKVWVNTDSRVYHCPSSPDYGTTREGEYMSEAAARGSGYHAAGRDACDPNVTPDPLPGAGPEKVWVNTGSGVYHCPGSKSYGKSKRGKFSTEADAVGAGYQPAGKKKCR